MMPELQSVLLVCGVVVFSVVVWFIVARSLRKESGMSTTLDLFPGPEIRSSSLGSAEVNAGGGGIRIIEHQDGWVFSVMWIFGGGKLWLAKKETRIGPLENAFLFPFFFRKRRMLISGRNLVIVYGKLADFIAESSGLDQNQFTSGFTQAEIDRAEQRDY